MDSHIEDKRWNLLFLAILLSVWHVYGPVSFPGGPEGDLSADSGGRPGEGRWLANGKDKDIPQGYYGIMELIVAGFQQDFHGFQLYSIPFIFYIPFYSIQ